MHLTVNNHNNLSSSVLSLQNHLMIYVGQGVHISAVVLIRLLQTMYYLYDASKNRKILKNHKDQYNSLPIYALIDNLQYKYVYPFYFLGVRGVLLLFFVGCVSVPKKGGLPLSLRLASLSYINLSGQNIVKKQTTNTITERSPIRIIDETALTSLHIVPEAGIIFHKAKTIDTAKNPINEIGVWNASTIPFIPLDKEDGEPDSDDNLYCFYTNIQNTITLNIIPNN